MLLIKAKCIRKHISNKLSRLQFYKLIFDVIQGLKLFYQDSSFTVERFYDFSRMGQCFDLNRKDPDYLY